MRKWRQLKHPKNNEHEYEHKFTSTTEVFMVKERQDASQRQMSTEDEEFENSVGMGMGMGTGTGIGIGNDNEINNDNDSDIDIPMQSISDEEALLACRAFLQKKNRLPSEFGWKQHQERKRKLEKSLALSSTADEGAGYFWEDPTQLKYLFTGRPRLSFGDDTDDLNLLLDDSDIMGRQSYDGINMNMNDVDEDDEDEDIKNALIIEDDEEDGVYFTGFPAFPPESFAKRSKNKKALFQDKQWKAKWYEARWGNFAEERAALRKTKRIEKYIQQIPSEILRSAELAVLTDDDIEDAIRTYIVANKRRSKSHKKRIEMKRSKLGKRWNPKSTSEDDDDSTNDKEKGSEDEDEDEDDVTTTTTATTFVKSQPTLDSFMAYVDSGQSSPRNELKERQRKRSKQASKSYETRRQNASNTHYHASKDEGKPRRRTTMRMSGALTRITSALNNAPTSFPRSGDIDILLEPKRLAGRKELLRDVLFECFGLRGKCVPELKVESGYEDLEAFYDCHSLDSINALDTKFVSKCTIYEIGCFIMFKLRTIEDLK